MNAKYDSIRVLTEIEHVRAKPEMYIGSTEDPTHLWQEVFDNALDESLAEHATKIEIHFDEQSFSVQDNGRGIPIGIDPDTGIRYPILAATKLFSGGKFDRQNYGIKMGLHGIGITAVNFLSKEFTIRSQRGREHFEVSFERGVPGGQVFANDLPLTKGADNRGTFIRAVPDPEIFTSTAINRDVVESRAKLAATFLDGLEIFINGQRVKPYKPEDICAGSDTPILHVEIEMPNGEGAIAFLGYDTKGAKTEVNQGSVNLLRVNQGAHIKAFEAAITRAWDQVLDKDTIEYLGPRDTLVGAKGFILAFLLDPKYAGQTKETLAGKYTQYDDLSNAIADALAKKLKERSFSNFRKALELKFKDYRKHINQISSTQFLNDVLRFGEANAEKISRGLKLDSKLFDCSSPKRDETELFIVEGDSAGGGLVGERDSKIHAVLPLRGKSLNVIDKELSIIMANTEIRSLINAIGCGVKHKEDPSRVRYSKIIISTDADIDGQNIQALLVGALAHLVPETVRKGLVYIAEAPLFGQFKGKTWTPVWDQSELQKNVSFKRYKGLGSLKPWQVAEVILNPKTRRLTRISVKDVKKVEQLVGYGSYKKELLLSQGVIK